MSVISKTAIQVTREHLKSYKEFRGSGQPTPEWRYPKQLQDLIGRHLAGERPMLSGAVAPKTGLQSARWRLRVK